MKDRTNLRSGYTTGACAAAAAKAALLALLRRQPIDSVTVTLPSGQRVEFALHSCAYEGGCGRASVIKDAGDDPDVTHRAEICARVASSATPGITLVRGVGVGLVTKPGLPVPPGEPAINPAPRQLIVSSLEEVLDDEGWAGAGLAVEISVPNGAELAKKTFNPRLGIVDGISILGTTGIVVPYSTSAWLASVLQGIDVAVAQGSRELVLAIGERGERLARTHFDLPEVAFVQIGPFFGDALRHCAKAGVNRVHVASMIGKLAKFAAGHESVHSSAGNQDFAFLAELARQAGADETTLERIRSANTAQEVSALVAAAGLHQFFAILCERAREFANQLTRGTCEVEVVLLGTQGDVLARHG